MRLYFMLVVALWTCQGSKANNGSPPDSKLFQNLTSSQDVHANVSNKLITITSGLNNTAETKEQKLQVNNVPPKTGQVILVQDPLNILNNLFQSNRTLKPTNTITSQDFAQATSLINVSNATSPTNTSKDKEDAVLNIDTGVNSKPSNNSQNLAEEAQKPFTIHDQHSTDNMKHEANVSEAINSTLLLVNTTNNNTGPTHLLDKVNLIGDDEPSVGNKTDGQIDESGFIEITNRMSDEVKVYSNEALLSWEEIKEKVAWDNEAANVLRDYKDKITISRAANNSECVKSDEEKLTTREKTLREILSSCENEIKREEWHELQNRTKEVLNSLNEIVIKTKVLLDKLTNDEKENERKATAVLKEAKEKLKNVELESIKDTLSGLKIKALKTDEEDYTKCIDKKAANEVTVDTLKDIMRIKNNCVG